MRPSFFKVCHEENALCGEPAAESPGGAVMQALAGDALAIGTSPEVGLVGKLVQGILVIMSNMPLVFHGGF